MKSSGNHKIEGNAEVDEMVVGGLEEGVGRKNERKKIVVFAVERKGIGIGWLYGKVIPSSSAKELGVFMKSDIAPEALSKQMNGRDWASQKGIFKPKADPFRKEGCRFPRPAKGLHRI